MRAHLPSLSLRGARTLDEALELLAARPGAWRPLAGGTDLMVQLAAGTLAPRQFLSIWGIGELRRIDAAPDSVRVGSLATFTDIRANGVLQQEFPLLCRAAAETGGIANQNRGTIGGNIANASPAADTPPVLIVYGAEIELVSVEGRRRVPYDNFHTGYKRMELRPGELIAAVHLPRRARPGIEHYRKVGARRAQAISKVCLAAAARLDEGTLNGVRLAFGSIAPVVLRATATERVLEGAPVSPGAIAAALDSLTSEIAPIDDIRSTAAYRRRVARNLLLEFLTEAARDVRG
jgi:CO/xanthine dehydrogenase FAD-binding subunit